MAKAASAVHVLGVECPTSASADTLRLERLLCPLPQRLCLCLQLFRSLRRSPQSRRFRLSYRCPHPSRRHPTMASGQPAADRRFAAPSFLRPYPISAFHCAGRSGLRRQCSPCRMWATCRCRLRRSSSQLKQWKLAAPSQSVLPLFHTGEAPPCGSGPGSGQYSQYAFAAHARRRIPAGYSWSKSKQSSSQRFSSRGPRSQQSRAWPQPARNAANACRRPLVPARGLRWEMRQGGYVQGLLLHPPAPEPAKVQALEKEVADLKKTISQLQQAAVVKEDTVEKASRI